jgi:opacity protein-like surface antigen
LLAALLAPIAAMAAEEQPNPTLPVGPYIAAGLGGDWVDRSPLTLFGRTVDSRWAAGWGGFATIGYRFDFGGRVEVEGSGRDDLNHAFNQNPWFGTQWDTSIMVNGLYDVDTGTAITPYFGGGIGLSHLSWGQNFRADLKKLPYIYDDSGTKLAWQAMIGVAYALTDHLALTLDGRYKGSSGYTFHSSGPSSADITNFDYKTRSLFAGARYSF